MDGLQNNQEKSQLEGDWKKNVNTMWHFPYLFKCEFSFSVNKGKETGTQADIWVSGAMSGLEIIQSVSLCHCLA